MQIVNQTRQTILAHEVKEARCFFHRLKGWIGIRTARPGQGLYLTPCHGVHTWGLQFPVDVVYIDPQGIILEILTLRPWCLGPYLPACRGVLELPAGTCQQTRSFRGDLLGQINGTGW